MRTTTTNDEVYLSILASRAVTGLARLAAQPDQRSNDIVSDLKNGVTFCDSLAQQPSIADAGAPEPLAGIIHRLTTEMSNMKSNVSVPQEEIRSKREFLNELVAGGKQPTVQELADAINFFFSATSGYMVRKKLDEELF